MDHFYSGTGTVNLLMAGCLVIAPLSVGFQFEFQTNPFHTDPLEGGGAGSELPDSGLLYKELVKPITEYRDWWSSQSLSPGVWGQWPRIDLPHSSLLLYPALPFRQLQLRHDSPVYGPFTAQIAKLVTPTSLTKHLIRRPVQWEIIPSAFLQCQFNSPSPRVMDLLLLTEKSLYNSDHHVVHEQLFFCLNIGEKVLINNFD